jgi:methionyl-tRNA formyltransferase
MNKKMEKKKQKNKSDTLIDLSLLKVAFFGTSEFAVIILEQLKSKGLIPSLIITSPDRPEGRKLILTPSPVKIWAIKNSLEIITPEDIKDATFVEELKKRRWDIFLVASYGKIIPKEILELPLHNSLNVHPSLLPKFRGPSPIQSAILEGEKETGVSIMILDEKMDHGPIIAVKKISLNPLPNANQLQLTLGKIGGELLAEIVPVWINRDIEAKEQEHNKATYAKKIVKTDGLINLTDDPSLIYKKIQAYAGWPNAYFFVTQSEKTEKKSKKETEQEIRVNIKEASFKDGVLEILKVIPQGKKEISYQSFLNGIKKESDEK